MSLERSYKLAHIKPAIKPLPCPCCGGTNLYLGPMSAMHYGIMCWRGIHGTNKDKLKCGISVRVELPYLLPKGTRTKPPAQVGAEQALTKAVRIWNRRPR